MGTLAYFRHTCTDSTMLLKRLFFKGRIRVKIPKEETAHRFLTTLGLPQGVTGKK